MYFLINLMNSYRTYPITQTVGRVLLSSIKYSAFYRVLGFKYPWILFYFTILLASYNSEKTSFLEVIKSFLCEVYCCILNLLLMFKRSFANSVDSFLHEGPNSATLLSGEVTRSYTGGMLQQCC